MRSLLPHREKILLDNSSFHDRMNLEKRRKEVTQGEKDSEQQGSCQGGSFLDNLQEGSSRKSWQDMPQVKGLKELKLPVGSEMYMKGSGNPSGKQCVSYDGCPGPFSFVHGRTSLD
jgi:hypothetical protein